MTGHEGAGMPRRIRWSPKLAPARLVRLYHTDAAGLLDTDLLDNVGWALYARCQDVERVTHGRVVCPCCACDFPLDTAAEAVSTCPQCGWQTTKAQWRQSWEHQDLNGHCAEFAAFIEHWPRATTAAERMRLIDRLVHALHQTVKGQEFGNFAARNLLEGRRPSIARVLDELAYGPASLAGHDVHEEWRARTAPYFAGRRDRPPR